MTVIPGGNIHAPEIHRMKMQKNLNPAWYLNYKELSWNEAQNKRRTRAAENKWRVKVCLQQCDPQPLLQWQCIAMDDACLQPCTLCRGEQQLSDFGYNLSSPTNAVLLPWHSVSLNSVTEVMPQLWELSVFKHTKLYSDSKIKCSCESNERTNPKGHVASWFHHSLSENYIYSF